MMLAQQSGGGDDIASHLKHASAGQFANVVTEQSPLTTE
jgi:hypothetical protein